MTASVLWGELPARLNACASCQAPFKPHDVYLSQLCSDAQAGFKRQDYCLACWEQLPKGKKKSRGYWRAKVPARDKKATSNQKQAELECGLNWLKQHLNDPEADRPTLFVLAMLLARHKRLIFRQEIDGLQAERLLLYEIIETQEIVAVPKVKAMQLPLAQIQETLKRIIGDYSKP